jgi:hypothetical protein
MVLEARSCLGAMDGFERLGKAHQPPSDTMVQRNLFGPEAAAFKGSSPERPDRYTFRAESLRCLLVPVWHLPSSPAELA